MSELFEIFLRDIMGAAFTTLDNALLWMMQGMLHVESMLGGAFSDYLTVTSIDGAFNFLYNLAAGLIVLKFMFKGFEIYILWRDGDADSSPQDMLIGSLEAMVVMTLFPKLYEIMADVTIQVARYLLAIFGVAQEAQGGPTLVWTTDMSKLGVVELIFVLVFVILALVLCVKMISRGFELLVLRLGVPIACLGLIDSDKGVFKSYIQIFYKAMFTSIIQIVLMSLAFRVITGLTFINLVAGISIVTTAFATPVLMQQILVPTGRGGGVTQKIYTTAMAANAIKSFVK